MSTERKVEEVNYDELQKSLSGDDKEANFVEHDPYENVVAFAAGKAGLDKKGMSYCGKYLGFQTINAGKKTESKKHIFLHKNGTKFGIWGTGVLNSLLKDIEENTYVKVVFEGKAEQPFQEGQSIPFLFKVYKA